MYRDIRSSDIFSDYAELVPILKEYSKAAMKTKPLDLLNWSLEYFSSRCDTVKHEAKHHADLMKMRYSPAANIEKLRMVYHSLLRHGEFTEEIISHVWTAAGLDMDILKDISQSYYSTMSYFDLKYFMATAVTRVGRNITECMIFLMRIFSPDDDGAFPHLLSMDYNDFVSCYKYLAASDCEISETHIEAVISSYADLMIRKGTCQVSAYDIAEGKCHPLSKEQEVRRMSY